MTHLTLTLGRHSPTTEHYILGQLSGLLAASGEESNLRHNDIPKSVALMEKDATFDTGGKGVIVAPMEEEEENFDTDGEDVSIVPMEEEATENRGIVSYRIVSSSSNLWMDRIELCMQLRSRRLI